MAKPNSKFLRMLKWAFILLLILLAIPPFQVALTKVWDPTYSPMQLQRKIEGRDNQPILWVPLDKIPVRLIHFIWASEDQAFFDHGGFDMDSMLKAIEAAKKKGAGVQGASTITMQCARSVFLWQGRSYVRKALEAYYTLWMELLLSKPRILELYLNHIEFGPGIYGIGAAAQSYYKKTPDQLTRSQMIALAAILPNPLEWSPVKPNAVVQSKMRRIERLSGNAPFPKDELK